MRKLKIQLFQEAQKRKKALGQFNFSDISQLKAIIAVSRKLKQSFILGTSEGESNFLSPRLAVFLRNFAEKELGYSVILNLDHGKSFSFIKKAIDAGYDMVHFDGSTLSFKKNIKETKKVVNYAKKKGVIVEGELGYLGGTSQVHKKNIKINKEDMTLPEEAQEFVEETKVNALAVVIGNVHGVYSKMPNLDQDRLFMIKSKIGKKAFLVLHGGSGISNREIKKAISRGIVKININTEIRAAWRAGIEEGFQKNKTEAAPYKIFPRAIEKIEKVVEQKIKLFSN